MGLGLVAPSALGQSEGRITFRVVDGLGRITECEMGAFVSLDGKTNLTSHFDGLIGTHIPYGRYKYRIWQRPPAVPGPEIVGSVDVTLPDKLVVLVSRRSVFGSVGDSRPAGFARYGKVEHMPSLLGDVGPESMWIRLSPLFEASPSFDVAVDASGEFRIYQLLGGAYLLTLIRQGEIIYSREVVFGAPSRVARPFVVDISEPPSSPIYVN